MIGRLLLAGLALALVGAASPPTSIPSARLVRLDVHAPGGRVGADGLVVTNVSGPCGAGPATADTCVAVRIDRPGQPPFVLKGTQGTNAQVGIGPLARGAAPAVILETFTGGAHCCEHYAVALPGPAGWRRVELARTEQGDQGPRRATEFDGGLAAFPTDVDGDGTADFVLSDDAFPYAFTDYADSWSPPVVLDIVGDRFVDVSARPAFRPLFAADAAKARATCLAPESGRSPNGACAAYAADAARLGRFAQAWAEVLAHYDRSASVEGLTRCTAAYVDGHCPPGREVRYPDYPAALRAFLIRTGYLAR